VNYGTFFFPRLNKSGDWVLQTDRKEIIDLMQERNWNTKSPWRQCLSGTSFGFTRSFDSARNAKESVTRILSKLALGSFDFIELGDGKGWEIKTSPTPQNNPNPCAYAVNYSNPTLNYKEQ
jgi:hypothetical protein